VSTNIIDWNHPQAARFKEAMDDDFNTSEAMAVLFDLANEVNKTKLAETASLLKNLAAVVGLLQRDADEFLQGEIISISSSITEGADVSVGHIGTLSMDDEIDVSLLYVRDMETIDRMIDLRIEAKKSKNFAEADRIRKELADAGIILEDTPQGTTWRRA